MQEEHRRDVLFGLEHNLAGMWSAWKFRVGGSYLPAGCKLALLNPVECKTGLLKIDPLQRADTTVCLSRSDYKMVWWKQAGDSSGLKLSTL